LGFFGQCALSEKSVRLASKSIGFEQAPHSAPVSNRSEHSWNRFDDLERFDVILSSGYLAFASHLGFLRGLVSSGIVPNAIVGTSSGALVGALYAAGHDVDAIAKLLTAAPPLRFLRPSWRPWLGAFDSQPLLRFLERWLPSRFEDLRWPFAVGVIELEANRHRLLSDGELPKAVLASCAVPRLIRSVRIAGAEYADGGTLDRLGLGAWREWRPAQPGILHRIERSMGREQTSDAEGVLGVNSPRSANTLLRLRNFDAEMAAACERTRITLRATSRL
jgi:predicted acylesterase/phospholipase RssA